MHTCRITREDLHDFRICLDDNSGDPLTAQLMANDCRVLDDPVTLQKWVAPDVALVDIGANVGCFSLVFAKKGHPVLALEAAPTNAQLLSQGVAANGLSDVEVHNVAVSDRNGSIAFCEAGPFGYVASEGTPKQASTTEVAAVALDGWSPAGQLSERIFIKMDIEGHEISALKGMGQFLRQRGLPPMFIESNGHCLQWFGATPVNLCQHLDELGYTVFRFEREGLRVWGPQEPQIRVVENLLCVHTPDDRIQLPPVKPARPARLLQAEIANAAKHPNPAQRAYLARTVAAFPELTNNADVIRLVERLRQDPDQCVRESMSWAA